MCLHRRLGRYPVLPLAGFLLDKVIRHEEAGSIRASVEGQPVARTQIAREAQVDTSGLPVVCEVLDRRRIQVSVRRTTLDSDGDCRSVPSVLVRRRSDPGVLARGASALQVRCKVVALQSSSSRIECDHAAQPATVFGWNASREDTYGFEFSVLERGRESDGPVVVQRHAVNHVLGVVFGTARMQDGVGLEQPARHRRDDIDGASPQHCP